MICTVVGEPYVNFGYVGTVVYAVFLAWFFHWLYVWVLRAPYLSVVNFWYLTVYAILIQVLRDGLWSFVIYQCDLMQPLTMITLLHLVLLARSSKGWRLRRPGHG